MSRKLEGKIAIVTGASKGIGASIAKHFGAEGASVVVNYASSQEGADKVVAEIVAQGGNAIAVQGDVSKQADVDRLFAETQKAYGKLDVLVNNAGIYEFSPLEGISAHHVHKQFDINVLGLLLATQKAAELFGDKGGNIINISSRVAVTPVPHGSVYSATKAAVDAITRSLALELGARNIRVNSLNPGLVETEGTQAVGFSEGEFRKQVEDATPLGRIGQPDDIGAVAVFLASDDSRWITGEKLVVSGGNR
jgi:3-oxoacyl-[acyl-carrier protein] reductase